MKINGDERINRREKFESSSANSFIKKTMVISDRIEPVLKEKNNF